MKSKLLNFENDALSRMDMRNVKGGKPQVGDVYFYEGADGCGTFTVDFILEGGSVMGHKTITDEQPCGYA